jgi:divalent metal cation (Fe/Co/Zn/Cd) transporter
MYIYEGILKSGLVNFTTNIKELLDLFDEEVLKEIEIKIEEEEEKETKNKEKDDNN